MRLSSPHRRAERRPWPYEHQGIGRVTKKEVSWIAKTLSLSAGTRVLDVACGYGRHAIRLARLGASVTGIDASPAMISRVAELRVDVVLASRPVEIGGRRLNQGFAWTRDGGYQGGRSKVYLPDEPDGREAAWFDQGETTSAVRAGSSRPRASSSPRRRPAARSRRSRSTSGAPIRPRRPIREISPCDRPLSGSRPRASSRTAGSRSHRPPPTPRDPRCRRWRCRPGCVALARRRPS